MPTQARPDPLKLAVCDDEAADRARIEQMAGAILREESIAAEIAGYVSAGALLAVIRAGRAFDVPFAGRDMMKGMDLAAALRAGHEDAPPSSSFLPIGKWRCGATRWRHRAILPRQWTAKRCGRRFCTAAPPGRGVPRSFCPP